MRDLLRRRSLASLVTGLVFLFTATGCDTERLAEFNAFASAGTAYVATFHSFTAAAATALITDSSNKLIIARSFAIPTPQTADGLQTSVQTEDRNIRSILASLQLFDRHATLLGTYFSSLSDLGGSRAPEATAAALSSLADTIAGLNTQLAATGIGNASVKDALGPASTLIIGHFQVRALDKALAHDAPIIDQALALQQAAVSTLAVTLRSLADANFKDQEQTDIVGPYIAPAPLPPNWAAGRDAYLRESATVAAADGATSAVTALRAAFHSLVTEPRAHLDLKSLFNAISTMASAVSATTSSTP